VVLVPQLQFAKVVHKLVSSYRSSSSLAHTLLTCLPHPAAIRLIPASVLLKA